MPDDLDDKLRAAMKVLDGETPSGYFDAAPNLILARLEDGSMQHGTGTSTIGNKRDMSSLMGPPVAPDDADTNPTPKVEASDVRPLPTRSDDKTVVSAAPTGMAAEAAVEAPAPVTAEEPKRAAVDRDEDSGLHDIRNLAQSTKQRLSAKRITQNPPLNDDALAASSGSFAGIALPQPAKMVALPELEDLPSKQEIIAAQKAAAKARKEKKPTIEPTLASKDVLAPQATANAALAAMSAAPVAAAAADAPAASSSAVPVRQAFTLPSMERKKSKGPIIAVLGLGVAAAAGGLIFMSNSSDKKSASSDTVAAAEAVPAATADKAAAAAPAPATGSAAVEATPPAPPPAAEEPAKTEEAAAAPATTTGDDDKDKTETKAAHHTRGGKGSTKKDSEEEKKTEETKTETKVEAPKEIKTPDGTKRAGGGEAEPSFDALLKEAGVEDKKEVKPKLEKKSLSGDDFKKGMGAIQAKAQGCYKGTQGTASVKLTVAPDGKVKSVSVGGQFAGKPEAACVEAAVKAATFPPWDGGPQSFNYSYMLSD